MLMVGLSFTAHCPAPKPNQAHLNSPPRLVAMDVSYMFEELFTERYEARMSARQLDGIVCVKVHSLSESSTSFPLFSCGHGPM